MSTEGIDAFVAAVYAVRWVLVVLGFIALGGLAAGAGHRAEKAERRAYELAAENAALRAAARRREVIALKPRTEARRG